MLAHPRGGVAPHSKHMTRPCSAGHTRHELLSQQQVTRTYLLHQEISPSPLSLSCLIAHSGSCRAPFEELGPDPDWTGIYGGPIMPKLKFLPGAARGDSRKVKTAALF